MGVVPTCWLGNAVGGSQVQFSGKNGCWPTPEPYFAPLGSTHQMLPGLSGPGLSVRQDFGWASGTLSITVPFATTAQKQAIEALYKTWTDGKRPSVQFHNGTKTWKCRWLDFRATKRTDVVLSPWQLQIELQIEEEVS